MRRASLPLAVAVVAVLLASAVTGGLAPSSVASEPPESTLTAPQQAGAQTVTWTGTVQPGTNPTSVCRGDQSEDRHRITFEVPATFPEALTYSVTVKITWEPNAGSASDLILTLFRVDGETRRQVASSDGGSPEESVTVRRLEPGTYEAAACAFANATPQEYSGSATVEVTSRAAAENPPPAPAQGLEFSASVPADIQRDEGEPIIEIDPTGHIYTCGPTGFSQAEDYLQVSTDGGDQFHLLGEPPRGQQSLGGGGDCALGTGLTPNSAGNHQLAYVGLSGLIDFTTATSPDNGRTFLAAPVAPAGPGVDRQWITFSDADTVFLNYNRVAPRAVTVQRSDDGGLRYGAPVVVAPNPSFPGPIKAMPPELNPTGNGEPVLYFPWTQGTSVRFAVSVDHGATWRNCTAVDAKGDPSNAFAVADHDQAGNVYIAYTDAADFNTYLVHGSPALFERCAGSTASGDAKVKENPGFSQPVQVNRGDVRNTVFPWIAADGEPGRVAVTFYGTQTGGERPDSDELKASWHVYVNQSLNALDTDATFSQVRATTHPNHYDQICLLGLGCSAGGDRSLVDFFAIDYNRANGELVVVYNRSHKRPDDTAGTVSTPIVARQISGPSNGGGTVERNGRSVVRSETTDPTDDAIADYSSLGAPPSPKKIAVADFTKVTVGPELDLQTGAPVEDGGFSVTMHVADLSTASLQQALRDAQAQSLLWIFRYVDGYRYSAASARWDPARGFTFGFNGYRATLSECGSPEGPPGQEGDQCLQYPGDVPIPGAVDVEAKTITLSVPRARIEALRGGDGPDVRPKQVQAEPGDRLYDAAAFSVTNPSSPNQTVQSFLYPLDNTAPMDFLLPGPVGRVERAAGPSRIATAAVVSEQTHESARRVVLARADRYPDALAGGPLAVALDAPLLLSQPDALSEPTRAEIERLGASEAVLLGGEAALSAQVEQDVEELGLTVRRVAGPNRFATAVAIAEELGDTPEVFVTEGASADPARGWPDALSAAGIASALERPILLVTRDRLPEETAAYLAPTVNATIVGGASAVSAEVEDEIARRADQVRRLSGPTRYDTSRRVAQDALERGLDVAVTWVATGRDFADGLVAGPAAAQDLAVLVLVDGQDLDASPATLEFLRAHADRMRVLHIAGGPAAVSAAAEQRLRALVRG